MKWVLSTPASTFFRRLSRELLFTIRTRARMKHLSSAHTRCWFVRRLVTAIYSETHHDQCNDV
jgi:hypothetical protein